MFRRRFDCYLAESCGTSVHGPYQGEERRQLLPPLGAQFQDRVSDPQMAVLSGSSYKALGFDGGCLLRGVARSTCKKDRSCRQKAPTIVFEFALRIMYSAALRNDRFLECRLIPERSPTRDLRTGRKDKKEHEMRRDSSGVRSWGVRRGVRNRVMMDRLVELAGLDCGEMIISSIYQ